MLRRSPITDAVLRSEEEYNKGNTEQEIHHNVNTSTKNEPNGVFLIWDLFGV
jgi:hypothetical protein